MRAQTHTQDPQTTRTDTDNTQRYMQTLHVRKDTHHTYTHAHRRPHRYTGMDTQGRANNIQGAETHKHIHTQYTKTDT